MVWSFVMVCFLVGAGSRDLEVHFARLNKMGYCCVALAGPQVGQFRRREIEHIVLFTRGLQRSAALIFEAEITAKKEAHFTSRKATVLSATSPWYLLKCSRVFACPGRVGFSPSTTTHQHLCSCYFLFFVGFACARQWRVDRAS